MQDIVLWIVLVVLFSILSAGAAGYWAYKRGRGVGMQTEKTRQTGLLTNAEEQAARSIAEAETEAKLQHVAIKEEEVLSRN